MKKGQVFIDGKTALKFEQGRLANTSNFHLYKSSSDDKVISYEINEDDPIQITFYEEVTFESKQSI